MQINTQALLTQLIPFGSGHRPPFKPFLTPTSSSKKLQSPCQCSSGDNKSQPKPRRAYPFDQIEPKWQNFWEINKTFRTPDDVDTSKPKSYILDMFPYPSSKERRSFHNSSYRRLVGDVRCNKVRLCSSGRIVPISSRNGSAETINSKCKTLDKSSTSLDHMVEYEHQLQELFTEIKNLLAMGNKIDVMDLLQANYEVVKGEVASGSQGIEQVALLDILALGYMGAGEFSMLEHILQMMKEMMAALDDCMPLMDSILMHMGSMFTHLGKHEDAILVYERGLKILQNVFGNESPFLITPLMGMAKIYRLIGRATKATEIYHKTISILEKKRGTESEELVLPLFNLGNLLINEGKAVDAEACFTRILSIHVKVYGANDGRVGIAMCSLAHALCAKGSVDEAICMYKNGLQVINGSEYAMLDDDVLEKMRIDLAELLHVTGREQEGRELLQECLLITEKVKGIGHPSTVVHLINLAASHSRSKNFVEAERMLRACLQIMRKSVMPDDQSVTVPMLHLAVALYHMKRDAEAETFALEAVRIRENAFGKESLPVGEALDCLVSIQTRLGKDDIVILDQLRRILSIQERELGYESEVALETLKKVIFYLGKTGKKDEKFPLERRLQSLRNKHKYGVVV